MSVMCEALVQVLAMIPVRKVLRLCEVLTKIAFIGMNKKERANG